MHEREGVKYIIGGWARRCVVELGDGYGNMREFMLALPEKFAQGEGSLVYKGRNELRAIEHEGREYVVKSFHRPHFINSIVYGTLRRSKAERSLLNAQKFIKAGVGTPAPVGCLEVRRCGRLCESYYVSEFSACPYVFNQLFEQKFEREDDVLREIGRVTAHLHNHGYAHKDYGRGNILFGFRPDGSVMIEVVDLNRLFEGNIDLRRGCKNLERLPLTPHMRQVLATAYAQERGLDAEECRTLMEKFRNTQPGKIDGKY